MRHGRRINVIYNDNSAGLSRDAFILRDTLEKAGHRVWLTPKAPRTFPRTLNFSPEIARQTLRSGAQGVLKAVALRSRLWDVNIFLERLVPAYFGCAPVNCFLPNQEWLAGEDRHLLSEIDLVLFKTRHAMSLLRAEARSFDYIGFTSLDRLHVGAARDAGTALHVCGWNPHKGTNAVVGAWSKHPEWPQLTLVSQLAHLPPPGANVKHIASRVADRRLRRLQNECAVHVCPSEVEGFGHTLMEAMSCGAVLITTDAPPMDEMVSPEEAFLVPHASTEPMGAGVRYIVDQHRLAETIARVWTLPAHMLQRIRRAARARYESSRAQFEQRLLRAIEQI